MLTLVGALNLGVEKLCLLVKKELNYIKNNAFICPYRRIKNQCLYLKSQIKLYPNTLLNDER